MSAILTSTGPELQLLRALAARSWLGNGPDGRDLAHALIAHGPVSPLPSTAETPETRMRRLAECLGELG
ncbi:hypothetical protein [Streptomyces sp. NPDC054863]